jgi:hypothetical protein
MNPESLRLPRSPWPLDLGVGLLKLRSRVTPLTTSLNQEIVDDAARKAYMNTHICIVILMYYLQLTAQPEIRSCRHGTVKAGGMEIRASQSAG